MSIRFAAPKSAIRNRMENLQVRSASFIAANDNAGKHSCDAMLHAALKHFADHGLAAARHAGLQAEQARKTGDDQSYHWWLEICRTLDRRMAQRLDLQAIGS